MFQKDPITGSNQSTEKETRDLVQSNSNVISTRSIPSLVPSFPSFSFHVTIQVSFPAEKKPESSSLGRLTKYRKDNFEARNKVRADSITAAALSTGQPSKCLARGGVCTPIATSPLVPLSKASSPPIVRVSSNRTLSSGLGGGFDGHEGMARHAHVKLTSIFFPFP